MIGILCAVEREFAPFSERIDNPVTTRAAGLEWVCGTLAGQAVVAVCCGIGKVNAAIATQALIDRWNPTALINSGTAGGMDESLEVYDTIVSTQLAHHDFDHKTLQGHHPFMTEDFFAADADWLAAARAAAAKHPHGPRVFFGRMVAGEAFIEDEFRAAINQKHAPLSVDMESSAMAHAALVNNVPFLSIRTITDTATHKGVASFMENLPHAADLSCKFALAVMAEMDAL